MFGYLYGGLPGLPKIVVPQTTIGWIDTSKKIIYIYTDDTKLYITLGLPIGFVGLPLF